MRGMGPQTDVAGNAMTRLVSVLAGNEYLAGYSFPIAGITASVGHAFAGFVTVETPERLRNLQAWRARLATRTSFAG